MPTQEKADVISGIKEQYARHSESGGGVIFADFFGLKVSQFESLRSELRQNEGAMKVYKNTLVLRAMKESGIDSLDDVLKGQTVVAFSPDETAAPKTLSKFAKGLDPATKAELRIKGGVIGGKFISSDEVENLASLPSREEVLATLLALIQAPATQLLRLINEPGSRVARIIKASSEKTEEAQ